MYCQQFLIHSGYSGTLQQDFANHYYGRWSILTLSWVIFENNHPLKHKFYALLLFSDTVFCRSLCRALQMLVQTLSNFSIYLELKICGKTSFFRSKCISFLKISYSAAVWELSWPQLIWLSRGLHTCPVFHRCCPAFLDVYSYCRILIPTCVSVRCLCLHNSMSLLVTFQDCEWSILWVSCDMLRFWKERCNKESQLRLLSEKYF